MNQKNFGILLILLGLIIIATVFFAKLKEDAYLEKIIANNDDNCYLDDGTCLHDERNFTAYYLGGIA